MTSNVLFQSSLEENSNHLSLTRYDRKQTLSSENTNVNQYTESKKDNLKIRFLPLIDIILSSLLFTPCVIVFWVISYVKVK
jgi:hypothetical protein